MATDRRADRESEGWVRLGSAIQFSRARRVILVSKATFTPEDLVATSFAGVLERLSVRYAVVAGYVAILLGRARRSDDIDFIVTGMDEDGFLALCRGASRAGFTLMQGDISSEESVRRAYRAYLGEGYAVRFTYRQYMVPNIEFKLARTALQRAAVDDSYTVIVNDRYKIRVSPIELQIAYKLYLGSEKDVGDAVFLYTLFRRVIDTGELRYWCRRLRVDCGLLEE